jgi:hypothetical protein
VRHDVGFRQQDVAVDVADHLVSFDVFPSAGFAAPDEFP